MFESVQDLRAYVEQEGYINKLELRYSDLEGHWRSLSVPLTDSTWETLAERGFGFDASSVGLAVLEKSDMVLRPVPEASFTDPVDPSVMVVICRAHTVDGDPSPMDPRSIAEKVEETFRSQGMDSVLFAPEYEFYLFQDAAFSHDMFGSSVELTPFYDTSELPPPRAGYHHTFHNELLRGFWNDVLRHLTELKVPVRYFHHEVGRQGQMEIEVIPTPLVKAADHAMLIKYVVKSVASRYGLRATFMPKPISGVAGTGLHCHQTLFSGSKNLFYSETGYSNLSDTALSYIAGLLSHGRSLAAITNPSTNSYRRLVPGYEAPTKLIFSRSNRSAAIRIPAYANSEAEQRIEYRPPDPTANPYLLLAAQALAGLDGIRRGLNPTDLGFGPIEEDIFRWSEEKAASLPALPASLDEALQELENDSSWLKPAFPDDFIEIWTSRKRRELRSIEAVPVPAEFEYYFNV